MKLNLIIALTAGAFLTANVGFTRTVGTPTGAPAQIVVTVMPASGNNAPESLGGDDLSVQLNKAPARVLGSERLTGDKANMQLFVLLDDSTRSSSLSLQLPELKKFLGSLPASTEVAIGYMRNGTFGLAQGFTADHDKAANALRLPMAIPGENGSPYFALSDLAKHWPSKEPTGRRAVLMLTDGVDRYYGNAILDDPYVDSAVHEALKQDVMVYSIYLRGAGLYGGGGWDTNVAQSRLSEVSEETGGNAYFQDFTDPVSIAPFLTDLQSRFDHQYRVSIDAPNAMGVQSLQVKSELRGVKIVGPTRIDLH
jgi:hypothetical protein